MIKRLFGLIFITLFVGTAFAESTDGVCTEYGCGTAFPKCNPNTFSVVYNAGGGTGEVSASAPTTCTYGTECLAPANTYSKTDYTFLHWSCTTQSGEPCVTPTFSADADISRATIENKDTITLTAEWKAADAITIEYITNGGVLRNAEYSCTATSTEIALPGATDISRANSTFAGWYNTEFGDADGIATVIPAGACQSDTGSISFVAQWKCDHGYEETGNACEAINYNITYELNGGTNNGNNPATYTINDNVKFATPVRENSTFVGWFRNDNELSEITSGSTGDITVSAKWTCNDGYKSDEDGQKCVGNTIIIAYNENGGTDVADTTCVYGEATTLAVAPSRTGYKFNAWKLANDNYVEASSEIVCDYMALGVYEGTSDAVSADWTANKYTVTYDCGDDSGTAPSSDTAIYDSEYRVNANTCVKTGYEFTGWAVSDTTDVKAADEVFVWNYDSEKTFTAQWRLSSYSCTAGTYLPAGATECTECTAGSYCVGGDFSYNTAAAQGIDVCGANSYSNAGAASCTACATGYTNTDDHVGQASCKIECAAGTYVSESGQGCVSVGTGYWSAGSTVSEGETSERNQCPADYRDGPAATSEAGCIGACAKECVVNETLCPLYAAECEFKEAETSIGQQTYGDKTCDATLKDCSLSGFTCQAGYKKNADGTACIASDATAIKYELDGGQINGNYTQACNVNTDTFDLPTNVTKTGYTFIGWKDATGATVTQVEKGTCTTALTFTAQWSECTPCSAGTGATCELSVVNNKCVYTTGCEANYHNEQGSGTSTPSCSSCVVSCSGNQNGFTLGEYNVCSGGSVSQCYRNCIVSDVPNSTGVSGTITAGGDNNCKATKCAMNNYLINGVCTGCANGYTSPNDNTGGMNSCTKGCTVTCSGNDTSSCPSNATCEYDTGSTQTGAQTQGGECSASSFVCPLSSFTCQAGYKKNADGTACIASDATAIKYELDGGQINGNYTQACNVNTDTFDLPTNVTKTGYTFVGWKDATGATVTQVEKGACTTALTFTAQWRLSIYSCTAGTYLPAGATECTECTAGSYCVGGDFSYNTAAAQGIDVCGANSYSNAGAASCTACATGYTNTDDHVGQASCKIECAAGTYVSESGQGCVSVGTGYWSAGSTVSEGETSERNQCPADYRDGPAATSEAGCIGACAKECVVNETLCPLYAAECEFKETETSIGQQTYGDKTCDATLKDCSLSGFTCQAGYKKNADGTACIASDATAIKYELDGGQINGNYTQACNVNTDTFDLPTNVTKTGYTFIGWKDATGATVTQVEKGTCTTALTFTAQWSECTPCSAGTGATCELSVVNNKCVYTTGCEANYHNEQGSGTSTPSCSSCVVSCSGNQNGFTLGEYNVCSGGSVSQCYRNCIVSDVPNSTGVSGTITAGGDNNCKATKCAMNNYLSNGVCTGCANGYTSPNDNTGGMNSCTKGCTVTCSGNDTSSCPSNATCEYDTGSTQTGTQTQGGECSASSFVCPLSSFTCVTGYRKTADGTGCERADYNIVYDLGGGTNYAGAPTKYTAGTGIIVDGIPTYTGHVFVGWCLDAAKTECNDRVVITEQATGDVKVWAKWSTCPSDSVCNGGVEPVSCTSLTNGGYPYSESGASSISQCYKTCESYDLVGGTAIPLSNKVYYGKDCTYRGESTEGHTCNIVDGTCVITSCGTGYEMQDGTCTPCVRENALTYKPGQGCAVASCAAGYHPKGDKCEANVIDCIASNALVAQREWDATKGAYGICKIIECNSEYHLVSNTCMSDTEICEIPNGVGVREWDHRGNKWGECVATSCNPGYTNDSSLTNEGWKQCGRCNNAFGANGEIAVSSYVRECEIAACMYQGELYALENNECRLVCTEYSDETGYRYWDSKSHKCVHDCEPGYINW